MSSISGDRGQTHYHAPACHCDGMLHACLTHIWTSLDLHLIYTYALDIADRTLHQLYNIILLIYSTIMYMLLQLVITFKLSINISYII